MRRAFICTAVALGAALGPVAGADAARLLPVTPTAARATAGPRTDRPTQAQPTQAQIERALTRVKRSRYLWATVNVCLPRPHEGGLIGIRGEMPALGLRSTLSMTIQLEQYLTSRHTFVPVPGTTARRTVTLGALVSGIHQSGVEFPYSSDTGLLDASVTFTWTRNGHRLLALTRTTTSGHPSAAFGTPPGHSTDSCRL